MKKGNGGWIKENGVNRRITLSDHLQNYTIDIHTQCHIWGGGLFKHGYGQLRYGGGNPKQAHRVFYEYYKGNIPEGLEVRHSCHNPKCVNPDHLSVGTHLENMNDMKEAGRSAVQIGELNPNAKFTEQDVRKIKELLAQNLSPTNIAKMFNNNINLVHNVKGRRAWKHVI
jgi:hypothetical protein